MSDKERKKRRESVREPEGHISGSSSENLISTSPVITSPVREKTTRERSASIRDVPSAIPTNSNIPGSSTTPTSSNNNSNIKEKDTSPRSASASNGSSPSIQITPQITISSASLQGQQSPPRRDSSQFKDKEPRFSLDRDRDLPLADSASDSSDNNSKRGGSPSNEVSQKKNKKREVVEIEVGKL